MPLVTSTRSARHWETEFQANEDEPLEIFPIRENEKAPECPVLSGQITSMTGSHDFRSNFSVPRRGAEQSHESPGKSQVAGQGDSQSDSLGGVVDPRLALLIEVWPALDDDVKAEIVRLASYDVDDVTLAVAR